MSRLPLCRPTRLALLGASVAALALGPGCSDAALEPGSSSSELNEAMVGHSRQVLSVGGSVEIEYTGATRFIDVGTVFTSATAGLHTVTVEPLDASGDAALWVTNAGYSNLAIARPADSRSASLDFDFSPGTGQKIVIRDEAMQRARFRVSLGAPLNPFNPDPDEGDPTGGTAPDDLPGKHCDGVVKIESHRQTYDSHGNPVFVDAGQKGNFSVAVQFVSESEVRLTTRAPYRPARDLHVVATSGSAVSPSSPTQLEWDVAVSREANGTLHGSGRKGNADVGVAVGANEIQLTFAGEVSEAWNGNRVEIAVDASGKIPLSECR